jgi:hypothetical protein
MTIESSVAALTDATTLLTGAVAAQQTSIEVAVAQFSDITAIVNSQLDNVDNTSDTDKPVSDATVTALGLKQDTLVDGLNISTVNGQSLMGGQPLVIQRSATSLSFVSYEDRGGLRSLSPQADDSVVVEGLGLFMFFDSQDEPDDDETSFNTELGQWLLTAIAYDLYEAMALDEAAIRDELDEDEPLRFEAYLQSTGR